MLMDFIKLKPKDIETYDVMLRDGGPVLRLAFTLNITPQPDPLHPHTSRFSTSRACFSINARLGSTASPISIVNILSASIASSIVT